MTVIPVPCAVDPERWYDPALAADAKRTCATCPARGNCLTLALDFDEPWGVWGGLTRNERLRYIEGRPIRPCQMCDLDFISADSDAPCCDECRATDTSDLEDVTQWAAAGWTDRQIGEEKGWTRSYARDFRQRHGIPSRCMSRRGTTPANTETKPCGTPAAYKRHIRRNEPIDEACRKVNSRDVMERRALREQARSVSA